MVHEVVGTARYHGQDPEILKFVKRFEDTELYNCEGWYVLDNDGKQIPVSNKGDWTLMPNMGVVEGKDIESVHVNYESIVINTSTSGSHRISNEELTNILKRYDFRIEKKRRRTYLTRKKK